MQKNSDEYSKSIVSWKYKVPGYWPHILPRFWSIGKFFWNAHMARFTRLKKGEH
jgi:hypothetical protein